MATCCPRCQTPLIAGADYCHHCGQAITRPTAAWCRADRILLVLAICTCIIAWLLIPVQVETVLGTGPALLLVGACLAIVAARIRHGLGIAIGLMHVGICILYVMLVNMLNWGPHDAKMPFLTIGAVYLVTIIPTSLYALAHIPPAVRDPTRCTKCGYLLYGLSEPRCPECGTEFDLDEVRSVQNSDTPRTDHRSI